MMYGPAQPHPLVPAESGTHTSPKCWIPVFAGMSGVWEP